MNRRSPDPGPLTLEFAARLLAECKSRGLILSVHEDKLYIANPASVDNEPRRYTMRQAVEFIAGAPPKQSARTPGQIEAVRKKMNRATHAGGRAFAARA